MAEYCLKCARDALGMSQSELDRAVLPDDLDFCEDCGEWKHVVVKADEPTRKRFKLSILRILFGWTLSAFLLFALSGCGGQDSSGIRVNAPENVAYEVAESVDDEGIHHVQIDWWEKVS